MYKPPIPSNCYALDIPETAYLYIPNDSLTGWDPEALERGLEMLKNSPNTRYVRLVLLQLPQVRYKLI